MRAILLMLLVALFPMRSMAQEEPMSQVIERGLQRATSQSLLMALSI